MKNTLTITLAALALCACNTTTTREFRSADDAIVAKCQYDGTDSLNAQWQITNAHGDPIVSDCDSMRVVELGEGGHPATVCYYKGNRQEWRQYYSNMQPRSEGSMVDGKRQGHWIFYFPNGVPQAECTFVDGMEEGPYKIFRENGVPYYIGQYHQGQRSGTWEIYNPDGSLATTQEYSVDSPKSNN